MYDKMEKQSGYVLVLDEVLVCVRIEKDCFVYMLQSDEVVLMQYVLLFFDKWVRNFGWKWWKDYVYVGVVYDEFIIEVRDFFVEECK